MKDFTDRMYHATDFNRPVRRENQSLTCLVMGDSNVGKTSLLLTFATSRYPSDHLPTVMGHFVVTHEDEAAETDRGSVTKTTQLTVYDSSPQEGYHGERLSLYPVCDVILVVFSLANPASFQNIRDVWLPEIQCHAPGRPFIVVGTKSDLSPTSQGTRQRARRTCQRLGASDYIECSALTRENLKQVFTRIRQVAVKARATRYQHKSHIRSKLTHFLCGIARQT